MLEVLSCVLCACAIHMRRQHTAGLLSELNIEPTSQTFHRLLNPSPSILEHLIGAR
jgi:hypothetical protein